MLPPMAPLVKNSSAVQQTQETQVWSWVRKIPWGGNGNPLQYSCLEIQGQRSLEGYSPWGHKESDITEQWHTHRVPRVPTWGLLPRARLSNVTAIQERTLLPWWVPLGEVQAGSIAGWPTQGLCHQHTWIPALALHPTVTRVWKRQLAL